MSTRIHQNNFHKKSPQKRNSNGQKCPWDFLKSVHENSPILSTRIRLLCPLEGRFWYINLHMTSELSIPLYCVPLPSVESFRDNRPSYEKPANFSTRKWRSRSYFISQMCQRWQREPCDTHSKATFRHNLLTAAYFKFYKFLIFNDYLPSTLSEISEKNWST